MSFLRELLKKSIPSRDIEITPEDKSPFIRSTERILGPIPTNVTNRKSPNLIDNKLENYNRNRFDEYRKIVIERKLSNDFVNTDHQSVMDELKNREESGSIPELSPIPREEKPIISDEQSNQFRKAAFGAAFNQTFPGLSQIPGVQEKGIEVAEGIKTFVHENIFQPTMRNITSFGLSVEKRLIEDDPEGIELIDQGLDITKIQSDENRSEFQKYIASFLLGEDEVGANILDPGSVIKPMDVRVDEQKVKIEELSDRIASGETELPGFLQGQEDRVANILKKGAEELAFIGVFGSVGLDMSFIGGSKNAINSIVAVKNTDEAIKLGKELNVFDDVVRKFADNLVNAKDEKVAVKVLREMAEAQDEAIRTGIATKTVREQGAITTIRNNSSEDLVRELSGVIDTKSNIDLITRANTRLVDEGLEGLKKHALSGASDENVASFVVAKNEIEKKIVQAVSKEDKLDLTRQFRELSEKYANIRSEVGRALQAGDMVNNQTASSFLRNIDESIRAANKKAGKELHKPFTDDEYLNLYERASKIELMEESHKKSVEVKKLLDELQKKVPSGYWDQLVNTWKSGLLTGLSTSGLNIASTFWMGTAEFAKDIPATGIDMMRAWLTGQPRTTTVVLPRLREALKGVRDFPEYLRTGVSEKTITQELMGKTTDHYMVSFPDNPLGNALQTYTDLVFRTIGGEDLPFFLTARTMSLEKQARLKIINEGLEFSNKAAKSKWIDDYVTNPAKILGDKEGAKALEVATNDALIPVFQNDTILGKWALKLRDSLNIRQEYHGFDKVGDIKPLEIVIPFAKTPSAVATALIDYSPTGGVLTIMRNIGKYNPKDLAEGLGRGITGTGFMWLGVNFYNEDRISLGYPKTEKERAEWEATGKIPNAIKVGDSWIPMIFFGPPGIVMGTGGYYKEALNRTGSPTEAFGVSMLGNANIIRENSFLQGINQLFNAIGEPDRFAGPYVNNLASSLVPTIIKDIAEGIDPMERRAETLWGSIKRRVPGARQTVLPKLNVYGEPLDKNKQFFGLVQEGGKFEPDSTTGRILSGVEEFVDPFRASYTRESIINSEVEYFNQFGRKVQPTRIDRTYHGVRLEEEEFFALQYFYGENIGPVMDALLTNKDYRTLDLEEREKIFTKAFSEVKSATRDAFLPIILRDRFDIPENVPNEAIIPLFKEVSDKVSGFTKASDGIKKKVLDSIISKSNF